MTDFDKKLIEKANTINRWNYRDISVLIHIADTPEAKNTLRNIRYELASLARESI